MDSTASTPSFRLALALQILASKPAELSLRDYVHLLRRNISSGGSERNLDAETLWQVRALTAETRSLQLAGRVKELEAMHPAPAAKRRKAPVKGGVGTEWEKALEMLAERGGGGRESDADVLGVARVLWFTSEPRSAVAAMGSLVQLLPAIRIDEKWALLRKALQVLGGIEPETERAQGVVFSINALLAVVRGIMKATEKWLDPAEEAVDHRMQETTMLVGLFNGLGYENTAEQCVLEGFCAGLLQIVTECVGLAIAGELREKVLAEETGWYLLVLLDGIWGKGRKYCGGELARKVGDRLEEKLGNALKGNLLELMPVESGFVMGVVEVVGLDMFLKGI